MQDKEYCFKNNLFREIKSNTKTLTIMDTFEGIKGNTVYKRLIITNPYSFRYKDKFGYVYLFVERFKSGEQYENSELTFTKFKQNKDGGRTAVLEFVNKQINYSVLKKYQDTNRPFYFKKPYFIGGQNQSNREGYGWEWYGGDVLYEGTEYGETDAYWFAGAYLYSSSWNYDGKKINELDEDISKLSIEEIAEDFHRKDLLKRITK